MTNNIQNATTENTNRGSQSDSFQTFIPTKNMPSLLSYYFSLGALFPFIGIFFGITGLVLGIIGLKKFKHNPTPGAKGHAMFGIIFSLILLAVHFSLIILTITAN